MAIEHVKEYFKAFGREQDILEFSDSSATVELAAKAVGVEPARIEKTLSFYEKDGEHAFLIVTACEPTTHHYLSGQLQNFSNAKEWVDVCKSF